MTFSVEKAEAELVTLASQEQAWGGRVKAVVFVFGTIWMFFFGCLDLCECLCMFMFMFMFMFVCLHLCFEFMDVWRG